MRTGSWLGLALALTAAAPAVLAQGCPYDVQLVGYGEPSGGAGLFPATLAGSFDGSTACNVSIEFFAPPVCCNTFIAGQALIVGLQPIEHLLGNGCTLLASPDIIVPLPPQAGVTKLQGELPHDAALAGLNLYLQGAVDYFTTIGMDHTCGFTAGLRMEFI